MFCTLDDMEVEEKMLKNVQEEMQEIINKNLPIIHKELTRNEAEKLYEEHNTSKGRLQLDLQQNDIINMYYCEDYYNYFYDDIAINTGIIVCFELVKYDSRIFTKIFESY